MNTKVTALIDRINDYTNYTQPLNHHQDTNLDRVLNSALLRLRKKLLKREK